MRKLLRIALHEFKLAAANKAFVVITILGPFLILAVTVLPGLLSSNPSVMNTGKPMAVTGADGAVVSFLEGALKSQGIELKVVAGIEEGKRGVFAEDYAGYLSLATDWMESGPVYFTKTGMEVYTYGAIEGALGAYVTERKIAGSGIDPAVIRKLLDKPALKVVKLDQNKAEEEKGQSDFMMVLFTALAFVMLLYMTVLLYGQMIGRSVVLEKTSKTVEIMLSAVSSRELMFGKILGLGLAGIVQYAVWAVMGIGLVKVIGPAFHIAMPSIITVGIFAWLVTFFVLAFFLYASGYAALGAAAEDEHHLGQLAWPVIFCLMLPMVLISPIVMNPASPLTIFMSFFPMTSPIVMMVRILVSSVPAWEIAVCIALLLVTISGTAILAAKIFRVGILMTGKRAKFGEMLKWIGRP